MEFISERGNVHTWYNIFFLFLTWVNYLAEVCCVCFPCKRKVGCTYTFIYRTFYARIWLTCVTNFNSYSNNLSFSRRRRRAISQWSIYQIKQLVVIGDYKFGAECNDFSSLKQVLIPVAYISVKTIHAIHDSIVYVKSA